jgi:hypothetical protein
MDLNHSSNKNKTTPLLCEGFTIYEIYGGYGNNDHLSDFDDVGQEIRHNMWALVPNNVGDGLGLVNEDDQKYTHNDLNISNDTASLGRIYTNVITNLEYYLKNDPNPKLFYLKLLKLQNHLKGVGYLTNQPELKILNKPVEEDGSAIYNTERGIGDASYFEKITKEISERILSAMHGSSSVVVKDECRLGGGKACNQGEIENLTIKPLKESYSINVQSLPFKTEVEAHGGKVYAVGGAVRDELIGKESKDLDLLITGISKEMLVEILSRYGKVDMVGESFAVIKYTPSGHKGEPIDIALPRIETHTGEKGHKAFDIQSDHTIPIERDLERRDFTINAIAKDTDGNLVDPYGGAEDIKNKIIKVVNPQAFHEDPLRMLRAVQFAARFGFVIEPNTMALIQKNVAKISEIAGERILEEIKKIVEKSGDTVYGAKLLQKTGLFQNIFNAAPKINANDKWNRIKTVGEFLFLLTHESVNSPSSIYRDRLKGEKAVVKEIAAYEIAFSSYGNTGVLKRTAAHNMYLKSPISLSSQILPERIKEGADDLLGGKYPKSILDLTINGNDLMGMGFKGQEIGDAQKKILINIYADRLRNQREEIISWLKKQ